MQIFKKLRDAIFMIVHMKEYKKVSKVVLRENQRYEEVLRHQNDSLKDQNEKLKEKHRSVVHLASTLVDENKALKKKIDEYESGQERWEILDL
jgi:hypothetical protein